ncbi:hypothetical protein [Phaeocystidibacter luteus]|uniref:DUF4369 domain-containing protein n=1 Tax=Phaeocystidibacter luteus TaxID=911197 RepID=A0A6N6RL97_9FLAO|nr:hypothetical protein [Phaeocystidibacter luteus]KAB2814101.1 hypothetical protein F8C67_05305 [Phaeocystidibacter luteus]
MKSVAVLFALLFSILVRAEYNSTIFEFELNTKAGVVSAYINTTAGIPEDKMDEPRWLTYYLDPRPNQEYFHFHKELVEYTHVPWMDTLYLLVVEDSIHIDSIQSFSIANTIDWSYLWGDQILSEVDADDLDWLYSPPTRTATLSAELCEYSIQSHASNEGIENFWTEFEKLSALYDSKYERLHQKMVEADHSQTDAINREMQRLEEQTSVHLEILLSEYIGLKIVVITFCSC